MELMLMRGPGNTLVAADEESAEIIAGWPLGKGIKAVVTRVRNIKFHRKMFALLGLAFGLWEPDAILYKGEVLQKNRERFRKDILVLSGFGDPVVNIKGDVRYEAKSLAFGNMDEDTFAECYKAILDVVWRRIFSKCGYKSQQEIDAVMCRLLGFE